MGKQKKVENTSKSNHFVYCSQRKCIHTECLRHNVNTPWDVLIYRNNFNPDKDWNCKDIVLER